MCLLTYFPEGQQADSDRLSNGAIMNPDGNGYAILVPKRERHLKDDEPARIIVSRSLLDGPLIEQFMRERTRYPDGAAIFHSRLGTAGSRSKGNCHPYRVGGSPLTVVAHNGILSNAVQPKGADRRSDTRKWAEDWLPYAEYYSALDPKEGVAGLDTNRGRKALSKFLGSWNKIAILTVDPAFAKSSYLVHEGQGHWVGGVWYSNDSYEPWVPKTQFGSGWKYGSPTTTYQQLGTGGTKTYADFAEGWPAEKCYNCDSDSLDHVYGVCNECDACTECGFVGSKCQCYYPQPAPTKSASSSASVFTSRFSSIVFDDAGEVFYRLHNGAYAKQLPAVEGDKDYPGSPEKAMAATELFYSHSDGVFRNYPEKLILPFPEHEEGTGNLDDESEGASAAAEKVGGAFPVTVEYSADELAEMMDVVSARQERERRELALTPGAHDDVSEAGSTDDVNE